MLQFMDYVQNAFYHGSSWNVDNFYGTLTATGNGVYIVQSQVILINNSFQLFLISAYQMDSASMYLLYLRPTLPHLMRSGRKGLWMVRSRICTPLWH